MKKLYKFHWDCRRMGDLKGLFVANDEDVQATIGQHLYFGEVLGKHSEIYGTLEQDDLRVISEDQEKIKWLVRIMGSTTISGYNPLYYLPEEEE